LATCERLALTIYCLLDQMVLALRSTLATNNYTLAYAFSLTFFFVTIINITPVGDRLIYAPPKFTAISVTSVKIGFSRKSHFLHHRFLNFH
jgi:hypothetical protein